MDTFPVLLIYCRYRMMINVVRESDYALLTSFLCISLGPNCPQSLVLSTTKTIFDCTTFIKETDQLVKLLLAYKTIRLTVNQKTKMNIPWWARSAKAVEDDGDRFLLPWLPDGRLSSARRGCGAVTVGRDKLEGSTFDPSLSRLSVCDVGGEMVGLPVAARFCS